MREIKFRQWRPEGKSWHFFEFTDGICSGVINATLSVYPIYQFTGLHDENGKEIYEGDICKVDDGDNVYEVIFYMGGFMLAVLPRKIRIYHMSDRLFSNIEVIGNNYEIHKIYNNYLRDSSTVSSIKNTDSLS